MGVAMLIVAAGAILQIPHLLPSVLAGAIVFGAGIPWIVVGLITLVQRLTPAELQGRVYAAAETLITTPQTISIALGAALISRGRLPGLAPRHGRDHRPRRRVSAHPARAEAGAAPGHLHRCGGWAGSRSW